MTDTESRQRRTSLAWLPFRILAWIAGGLSIVNLVTDFDWVTLKGVVARCVETYARIVANCVDFLFGWIPVWVHWMQISETESHVLVLVALLATSITRGSYIGARDEGGDTVTPLVLIPTVSVGIPTITALLIPGPWGAVLTIVVAAGVLRLSAAVGDAGSFHRGDGLLSLIGAAGVCLLVVLGGSFFGV